MSHQTFHSRRNNSCTYNSTISDAHYGSKAAELKYDWIRDKGTISLASSFIPQKILVKSGTWKLLQPKDSEWTSQAVATARKRKSFRRRIDITIGRDTFTLQPREAWVSNYIVKNSSGVEVAAITHGDSDKVYTIVVRQMLPAELIPFCTWLVILLVRRRSLWKLWELALED